MSIKLICFDLDDTLWSTKQVMLEAETHVYKKLQSLAPALTDRFDMMALFQERLKQWKKIIKQSPELQHQVSIMRQRSLRQLLSDNGFPEAQAKEISEECFELFMHWRHQPEYFDHALEVLAELKQDYLLATITNGNACSKRLGLDKFFELHISAEELGIGKPEPEPFQAALDHFGVSAEQCLHIGDNPHDDIFGAHQLSIKSLWFNPKQKPWEAIDFSPSAEIHCLKEIPAAARQLR